MRAEQKRAKNITERRERREPNLESERETRGRSEEGLEQGDQKR